MKPETNILSRLGRGGMVFDGGIGSMLIAAGLGPGECPEQWNVSHPDIVRRIHDRYLAAGAEVVTTNTFGANPARLGAFGLAEQTGRFNNAGLDLARAAARRKGGFVVLSLGPTGSLLPPLGNADEDQIDRAYALQLDSIDRPVDLVLVETVFDLREGLVALAAARRAALAPVGVSVTFDRKPKGFFTSMGDAAAETIVKLEEAGADVVGLNCTLASTDMLELAREVRELTALPLVCQPNAGLPRMTPQGPVYEQTASEYARDAALMIDAGVNAVGGCCGTTPEFISGLVRRLVEYR